MVQITYATRTRAALDNPINRPYCHWNLLRRPYPYRPTLRAVPAKPTGKSCQSDGDAPANLHPDTDPDPDRNANAQANRAACVSND